MTHAVQGRTEAEVAHEQALGEISDVLLDLQHTIARAKRPLQRVREGGGHNDVELAPAEAIADFERSHERLMQTTCCAGDAVRLIRPVLSGQEVQAALGRSVMHWAGYRGPAAGPHSREYAPFG